MVKVVGYINVSVEQLKINEFASAYYHFNDRLNERYGVSISIEEYKELCKTPVHKIEQPTQNKKVGFLNIKGVDVLVVKEVKRNRRLITALPKNDKRYSSSAPTH